MKRVRRVVLRAFGHGHIRHSSTPETKKGQGLQGLASGILLYERDARHS